MSASAPTLPKRKPTIRRKSRKKAPSSGWLSWWPLFVGIALTPLALRTATVTALAGPAALRFLYPFALLMKLHLLGLADSTAADLSQIMMYLQFPLYGVFFRAALRAKGAATALLLLAVIHLAAAGLLFVAS